MAPRAGGSERAPASDARRTAQAQAGAKGAILAPQHTRRCPCAACEQQRKEALRAAIGTQDKRRRTYVRGHADPEHRAGWASAAQGDRLAQWITLHRTEMDERLHVTNLEIKPTFIAHLDGTISADAADLDAPVLRRALCVLSRLYPERGAIITGCIIERRTQQEVGAALHMSQQAVGKNLAAGLDQLLDIYAALLLDEQESA